MIYLFISSLSFGPGARDCLGLFYLMSVFAEACPRMQLVCWAVSQAQVSVLKFFALVACLPPGITPGCGRSCSQLLPSLQPQPCASSRAGSLVVQGASRVGWGLGRCGAPWQGGEQRLGAARWAPAWVAPGGLVESQVRHGLWVLYRRPALGLLRSGC